LISLKFAIEFDHSNLICFKRSRSRDQGSKSQRENFDCQITALFQEIGVAESSGDFRILATSWEILVCAGMRSTNLAKKQPRTTGATSGAFQMQCVAIISGYFLILFLSYVTRNDTFLSFLDLDLDFLK